jgi:branched-chain amino acid transport system ATP-binding protein
MNDPSPVLEINKLQKSFGGLRAVSDVSFALMPGELVGLVGPNGSGKTTVINLLSAMYAPDSGRILLDGNPVPIGKPDAVARVGMVRMFQLTRVFRRMSVIDNLRLAGCARGLTPAASTDRARVLLHQLGLAHMVDNYASELSGGQQKLLEFAACFIVPPRIALLDEPFAAVHPSMRAVMAEFIRREHAQGQTVLLVSHDMPIIVDLCKRTVCMSNGSVIADGETRAVLADPEVIEAYLGGTRHDS